MWILKGTLLGLWLFGFGTLALLYFLVFRGMPPNSAVSASLIIGQTILNPLWWTALAVCLAIGYATARSWPGHPVLWVALVITGLIPAGFLALFLTLYAKLN